jgi:hypothetical protein
LIDDAETQIICANTNKPDMQHSLYKYYDDLRWAEAFLDGELLFRSLSYFCDYEDRDVRGDVNEGKSIFRPHGGIVINNLTQGTTFTLPRHIFTSVAKLDEIFVFCMSRSQSDERRDKFSAVACVEILQIRELCERIEAALPQEATFRGQRVDYYRETESGNPRWALPDRIATSKLDTYAWQHEYRLIFCLTDALKFENVDLRLVSDNTESARQPSNPREYRVNTQNLRDICRVHSL